MTPGLLIAGRIVPVPGLTVIPPAAAGGPAWAHLDAKDYRMRRAPRPGGLPWVRQVIPHSTGGLWPMPIVPGAGPGGECFKYADIWQSDPTSSAAHLVVDSAGAVACFADLAYVCAFHAEGSNEWSVGIEMVQAHDGAIRQATIDATAAVIEAICDAMGIPFQYHAGAYRNAPLLRMEVTDGGHRHNLGGPSCVGVFGHRDNTSARGRGDPGDAIYAALAARAAEGLDYAAEEDLEVGRARQAALNVEASRRGETWSPLAVDGLIGPASIARARQLGFARWRDVPT